ncbi:hypothetical protein Vi05172_g7538 [Venturia inaequalis]|nr:hypothetical protein Vi05172_g7538 [Venturia inaequalis]
MAKDLSDMPPEIIDRIVDYLPNRDALLHLRVSCKNLCAKTLDRFSKAYFETFDCILGASNMRALCHFSTRPLVISHLISIRLTAPSRDRKYHNFWKAKNIDPISLATALNHFSHLRQLKLAGFGSNVGRKNDCSFMGALSGHLAVGDLEQLELHDMSLSKQAVMELVTMSRRTLKTIFLTSINFVEDSTAKREAYSPWTEVLMAMEFFPDNCEVTIEKTFVDGSKYDICPPWDSCDDWDGVYYKWKGLEIKLVQDAGDDVEDEDEDDCDTSIRGTKHTRVHIAGDANRWEGVKRTLAFALFGHFNGFGRCGWETEIDFWQAVKQADLSWDKKLMKLLQ